VITFTPESLAQLSPGGRHRFDEAFIRVLVRRLHAAHEALAIRVASCNACCHRAGAGPR